MYPAEHLSKTIDLMKELRVPIRDTYNDAQNLDDFYTNGNRYDGPRLLKVEWSDKVGFPEMKANKIYHISQHQSAAYDAYSIAMPLRYNNSERDDPIIHELVHFLQHNTTDEDERYIKFSGQNYIKYLTQRVELEAHAVQVLYILRQSPSHRDKYLCSHEQEFVTQALLGIGGGSDLCSVIPALQLCKERQLV